MEAKQEEKEIKNEEFSQFKETGDENYIHFYGYDGKHLYVYRGVNLSKLAGKSIEEKRAAYDIIFIYLIQMEMLMKRLY